MSSILAPVSPIAYKNGHLDWYGAVEFDSQSREVVWKFDAVSSEFATSQHYQDGAVVRRQGFRPASVQRLDDGRTLLADWSRGVIVDEDGEVTRTFSHELLNDTHEIQRGPDGCFLVVSTGLDTLLVLDEDFDELWRWHMWEHVEPRTRPEDYYPDQLWYRKPADLAFHPDDRYHLNYATVIDGSLSNGTATLLCSALNYGIFTVDMASESVSNEYRDLDECHNPCIRDGAYAVAESGADRVVLVDWQRHRETLFERGLNFVKDADPIEGSDDWLLTDTKNDRILIWNEDETGPSRIFELGDGANPYESDFLTGGDSLA